MHVMSFDFKQVVEEVDRHIKIITDVNVQQLITHVTAEGTEGTASWGRKKQTQTNNFVFI